MNAPGFLQAKHLIAATVAAACVALSMAGGGFEATAFAAAGLLVWVLVVVGLAVGLAPRSQPPRAAMVAGLSLAALAAMTGLSLAWASDDGHGFEDVVRALAYLGGFTLIVLASKRAEARPWLAGLTVGLAVVGAIALLARLEPSFFGEPDADLATSLPAAIGRLSYPIGYWNGLAAALASAIALLTWFGAAAATPLARAASVAMLPPIALALWMTDSRGGIVAAALAIAVLVAVGPNRSRLVAGLALGAFGSAVLVLAAEAREELLNNPVAEAAGAQGDQMLVLAIVVVIATIAVRYALDGRLADAVIPRRVARAVLAVVAVGAIVGLVAIDPIEQFDEFKAPPTPEQVAEDDVGLLRGGSSGRYQFWETAVDAFASSPVGGVGASGYAPYWFEHREVPIPATRAHSVAFETLAELGVLGLAALLAFFATATVCGIRRARGPGPAPDIAPPLALLAVGFAAAAVDWTWDLPAVFGIAVVAAALLTGPATMPGPDPGPPSRLVRGHARSRRGFALGVGVLLIAWVSICGSALLLLSASAVESSRDAAGTGDLKSAAEAANDAIDLQPWAAEPRTQLALVLEQAEDYAAAREAIDEAVARAPEDYRLRLVAARIEYLAGDRPAARAHLIEAHRLNPRDAEIAEQAAAAS